MKYKVLVTEPINEIGIKYLEERGYDVVHGHGIARDVLFKEAAGCDGILTRNANISEELMAKNPQLKVVSMHGVGVDKIDVEAATRLGVQVTNAPGSNKLSVAEFTIGLVIALARNILYYDDELRRGNWASRQTLGIDLEGKTLGIVGMGNIGGLVAKKAAALGMKVIGYSRRAKVGDIKDGAVMTNDLDKVVSSADFLSIHVPSVPSTAKIIGRHEIESMKKGAFLINTARGEVVDNDALVEALESGHLAGAAVDVFVGEIPAADNKLLHMKNVIVTPHAASFAIESTQRMALFAAMGIDEALSGKEISYPVNKVENARSMAS